MVEKKQEVLLENEMNIIFQLGHLTIVEHNLGNVITAYYLQLQQYQYICINTNLSSNEKVTTLYKIFAHLNNEQRDFYIWYK